MSRATSIRYDEPAPAPTDGEPPSSYDRFTLTFSKADADALASLCDVALKAAGLPASQAVECWMQKVRSAMSPPA